MLHDVKGLIKITTITHQWIEESNILFFLAVTLIGSSFCRLTASL